MNIANTMNLISIMILLLDKISFLLLSLFFGNIAYKGWKGKKNIIITLTMKIILGIICFFGGLIINDYFKSNFIMSQYIYSLIVGIILYILISLISTAFKETNDFVKKKDINTFFTEFEKLKEQFQNLVKELKEKNNISEELFNQIIKQESKNKFHKTKKFENMYKNPYFIVGTILSIIFFTFLITNITPLTKLTFKETFDFSFIIPQQMPEDCEQTNILLENYKTNKINYNKTINETKITNQLKNYYLKDKTGVIKYNNKTFFIATTYNKQTKDIAKELMNNYENIYNIKECSFNENYQLCNCIGDKKTDPIFTIPYLVEQGIIQQAIATIIKENIEKMIGNLTLFN